MKTVYNSQVFNNGDSSGVATFLDGASSASISTSCRFVYVVNAGGAGKWARGS